MKHKRIAFVCHPYHRGGVTRWMADMAEESAKRDLDVHFVTVAPSKPFTSGGNMQTMAAMMQPVDNVTVHTQDVGWEFEFGTNDYRAHVYRSLILNNVPEGAIVILSDDPAIWKAAGSLAGVYDFVGVLHSDSNDYYKLAIEYQDTIDLFVAVSDRVKNAVSAKIRKNNREKVFTIPCGIVLPETVYRSRDRSVLSLVYVGRLTQYQKRVLDLPPLCSAIAATGVNFHLEIIGSGKDEQQLRGMFSELDMQAQVSFSGWLSKSEIYDRLSRKDILLLTSDSEGMPIAVMEAFSMGCGVVSTRVSGVEDLESRQHVRDCLWLYTTGDAKEGASQILKAANAPVDERQHAARKLAEMEYSIQKCFERYNAIFNEIKKTGYTPQPSFHMPLYKKVQSFALSFLRLMKVKTVLSAAKPTGYAQK